MVDFGFLSLAWQLSELRMLTFWRFASTANNLRLTLG